MTEMDPHSHLNREQRRHAEKSERRGYLRRQHRPEQIPMLVKMQYVLAPLDRIIDEIERNGTTDTGPGGVPIFQPMGEQTWCATVPAILGIVDLFEMWAMRRSCTLDLAGLSQFAHRLEYGMPITQDSIDAARSVMSMLRRLIVGLSHDEAKQLLLQTQIKDELEARAIKQKSQQEHAA